ncbi:MAG: M48 family metalloprotease, partial [Gammaproteobacteria bacterium]
MNPFPEWVSDVLMLGNANEDIAAVNLYKRIFVCGLTGVLLVACVSRFEVENESEKQFSSMRTQIPISNNATQKAYVLCVSRAIIRQLDKPYSEYDWEVEVFDAEEVNAFAMPGGKIGVFTGILDVASTPDQLGAVIGHEVAHVTEQHSLERYNRELTTQGGVI